MAQSHFSKVDVPTGLAREALENATRALQVKDTDRALNLLQGILEHQAKEVIPVRLAKRRRDETDPVLPGDLYQSVRAKVMGILTADRDLLHRYRELMEPVARRLLALALQGRSQQGLVKLARAFFLTASGRQALFILVDRFLDEGLLEEARIHARSLVEDLARFSPKTLPWAQARLALALFGTGRREELLTLAGLIAREGGDQNLRAAGQPTTLNTFVAQLLGRQENHAPLPLLAPDPALFAHPLWEEGITTIREPRSDALYGWGGRAPWPWFKHFPVVPLIKGSVLYLCDGLKLQARSIYTGQRIWPDVRAAVSFKEGLQNRSLFFHVVEDRGVLFAYLEDQPQTRRQRALNTYAPIEAIPTRKLIAVDAASGKVLWNHAHYRDSRPEVAEFMKKLTINTPPEAVGNRLYVSGAYHEGSVREWVCCFDRTSGRLIWRTYLGEGQMELNMFGNPIKEPLPGHILEHEGVLYECTNVGTIAALDAATGVIRWISAYVQTAIPSTRSQYLKERYPGWMPSKPAVWKDTLFVAPLDSYDLYAVDRQSGALRPVPGAQRNLGNRNLYFLGIHGGNLIVAGDVVRAFDPETLRRRWSSMAPFGADPARGSGAIQGRPAVLGNKLLFTTRGRESKAWIFEIDLQGGSLLKSAVFPRLFPGNLAATQDAAAAAGTSTVRLFMDLEATQKSLVQAVTRHPGDPELRLRLGEIRRQQGSPARAVKELERALLLASRRGRRGEEQRERARRALYHTWLAIAQSKSIDLPGIPGGAAARFERALSYADSPRQKIRGLVLAMVFAAGENQDQLFYRAARQLLDREPNGLITVNTEVAELLPRGLLKVPTRVQAGVLAALAAAERHAARKQWSQAVALFQEALERFPKGSIGIKNVREEAGQRIREIIQQAGQDVYAPYEKQAARLFREGTQKGRLEALRTILVRYPQSRLVEKAYLSLSRALLAKGAFKQALSEIERHLFHSEKQSAQALVEVVRCLEQLAAHDSANEFMTLLEKRHPQARVVEQGRSWKVLDWVRARRQQALYKALLPSSSLPDLPLPLRRKWVHRGASRRAAAQLLHPAGHPPRSARDLALVYQEGQLVALRVQDGHVAWRKAALEPPRFLGFHDGRLILGLQEAVVVLDPARGEELWRETPEDMSLRAVGVGQGKVYLLGRSYGSGTFLLRGQNIISGEAVQETILPGASNPDLLVDPRAVLVRSYRSVRCLDPITGRELKAGNVPCSNDYLVRPRLNKNGDLMLLDHRYRRGSIRQPARLRTIDPYTGKTRFELNLGGSSPRLLAMDDARMLIGLRTRLGSSGARRRSSMQIVLVDTLARRELWRNTLRTEEDVSRGLLAPPQVFLNIRKSSRLAGSSAKLVRALDQKSGRLLWDSIQFQASRLYLQEVPLERHLLLRRSDMSIRRSQVAPPGSLYFLDRQTGRTRHVIDLDEATFISNNPNLGLYGQRLVLVSGPNVFCYASP